MKTIKSFPILLSLFFFCVSIHAQTFPDDKWEKIVHPAFQGWDYEGLDELREYVVDSTQITGMMIIQNGKVIFDFGNLEENSYIASCRKSMLAILYGKFVKDGTINLNKTLEEIGIDEVETLTAIEKTATIQDIISSRSGIFLPASNAGDMSSMAPERGSVKPGEFWLYSNWDFNIAGYIFEKETKRNIYDELQAQLAIPLQMQDWDRSLQEKSGDKPVSDIMAYHMWFSTRDMARIGHMLLSNGKWKGKQVIDKDWIREMTTTRSTKAELDEIAPFFKERGAHYSYGYMWWLWQKEDNKMLNGAYTALGAFGQNLTVFPEMDCVLAIKTNANYERRKGNHNHIIDMISKIYLPDLATKMGTLSNNIENDKIPEFISEFNSIDFTDSNLDVEGILIDVGYRYLDKEDFKKGTQILKFNTKKNPTAWNGFDSLGEAYFLSGDYKNAEINYKKAVELNKENQYGNNERVSGILKRLEKKMK